MNCRQISDFLMAYLDCELDPATRKAFEYHLALCPPCVAFMQSYEQTVRLGREAFECQAPPPRVPEELIRAILAATGATPPGCTQPPDCSKPPQGSKPPGPPSAP